MYVFICIYKYGVCSVFNIDQNKTSNITKKPKPKSINK